MEKRGRRGIGKVAVFACLFLFFLFLCTPAALANYNFDGVPVETATSGTVNGGVFIDYEPWAGTTTLTGDFEVPRGEVKWARLYTGIWGGTEKYEGWVNVTFNGVCDGDAGLGPIHLQGENDANPNVWCSTHGKYWIWYNVTDLVNAGAVNTASTTKINATVGGFDGRVYGLVLVVVYEGGDNPKEIQYWVNDGCDALHSFAWPHPAHDTGTTDFDGSVNAEKVSSANLTVVFLTAYEPVCDRCLKFNGHELDTTEVDSNNFELKSWSVTGYVAAAGNNAWYSRGEDSYVNVANAVLVLENEEEEEEEPTVRVSTDKPEYSPGDVMNVSLEICNPTEEVETFEWYFGVPQLGIWATLTSTQLPAEFDETFTVPISVGEWGATPFGIVQYVQLLDPESGEILDQDLCLAKYNPTAAAYEEEKATTTQDRRQEIGEEIKREVGKVELR